MKIKQSLGFIIIGLIMLILAGYQNYIGEHQSFVFLTTISNIYIVGGAILGKIEKL